MCLTKQVDISILEDISQYPAQEREDIFKVNQLFRPAEIEIAIQKEKIAW